MPDTFKFPNGGYDVTVVRKQDILDCLDENVIDKDVVLAVITQCELDASNFIKEGRWTGIPYLGSIRVPKHKQRFAEIKAKDLLNTAKENLDKERYLVFRNKLNTDIAIQVKQERFYRYNVSLYVSKHKKQYNELLNDKRAEKMKDKDAFARFMCYSFMYLSSYIPFD